MRLSADTQVHLREEFLTRAGAKAVHLELEVSRRKLEELIRPLIDSTMTLTRKALAEARLEGQRLSRVCLVGGSTRIPLVRALLEQQLEVEVRDEVDPDLAVGLGAAMQAGLLTGAQVGRILVDVSSHSLGVKVFGEDDELRGDADTFAPLIRRNTVLPAERAEEFYTMTRDQERIQVEVFQGEQPRTSDNVRVGAFEFPLKPAPEGSPVRVQFAYDLNGVVKVSVGQTGTDNQKTVALSVADAAPQAPSAMGAVERKARALLTALEGEPRARLEQLLEAHSRAKGSDRERAEEALLDFFLDVDAGPEAA
ncbi:MAG: Hsp70 family protein [Myxococcaceae bacterium]